MDAAVELVRGSGGVFDVTVDDALVFSRHREGRFPEPGEILAILRDGRDAGRPSREA